MYHHRRQCLRHTLFGDTLITLPNLKPALFHRPTGTEGQGHILLAADFMHLVQTRIATIDSYAVFWIMLMYLFMIRFIQMK